MKKLFFCILLAGCASVLPDQPSTRLEFNAPETYPEGIAYDSISNLFYVSSARLATIGQVDSNGNYKAVYSDPSLKSSYGLTIHPDGKKLYACISDANYSKYTSPDTRKKLAKLIAIDLSTGKKVDDIDLSNLTKGEHFANDVVFDATGNAYVTDSFSNVIYKVAPDGKATVFSDSPLFKTKGVGLNGIVCHPNGFLLTVSSGTGAIYKIDLKNPNLVSKVATDQFFVNGDGLVLKDNENLVLVQNGGSDKIYQLGSKDNWNSAYLSASTLLADRFTYPSTAVKSKNDIWVMNAKFSELVDSTSVPSKKFAIQKAVLKPLPK